MVSSHKIIREWSKIRESYESWAVASADIFDMVQLVSAIESSPYANGLFAWTSMNTLCITQTPEAEYPYDGPVLKIEPDGRGSLEFQYFDSSFDSKPWTRKVPGTEGFAHLERFIEVRRWFVR